MNNKGFAITTILYGILILFCLLLLSMLGILSTYRGNIEKLIENHSGARGIINNGSINQNTFLLNSGTGEYLGNGIYSLVKNDDQKWAGYCLIPDMFEDENRYQLSYSIQKVDGTLTNIGGHSIAAKEVAFYIDGIPQEKNPNDTININTYQDVGPEQSGYAPETNLDNDGNVHNIKITFKYNSEDVSYSQKDICVQPNRGLQKSVSVKIFNLKLVKLS